MNKCKSPIMLLASVLACSCSSQVPLTLVPVPSKNQQAIQAIETNNIETLSKMRTTDALVTMYPDVVAFKKYALLSLILKNKTSKAIDYKFSDLRVYVNGREKKIYSQSQWSSKLKNEFSALSGEKWGNLVGTSIGSSLANTSTSTSYYSGHVGSYSYSGSVQNSYTDHYAASQMNQELSSQINSQYEIDRNRLEGIKHKTMSHYLNDDRIPPHTSTAKLVVFKVPSSFSQLKVTMYINGELHEFMYNVY